MVGKALQVLLWLFLLGNGAMIYHRALQLFHDTEASMEDWVKLSIAAVFLVGVALLVYMFGVAGITYVTALV